LEQIPAEHVLLLAKSIYGTGQPEQRRHIYISEWIINNGYREANSEKTIMSTKGSHYILHGLFIDYMIHIPHLVS
jgi:hypothetical protein